MTYKPMFLTEQSDDLFTDIDLVEEVFTEARSIVRLNKIDRMKGLVSTSAIAHARQNDDRLYTDLEKAYKRIRVLKAKIRKKYRSKAVTTAKELMKNAGKGRTNKGMRDAGKAPDA